MLGRVRSSRCRLLVASLFEEVGRQTSEQNRAYKSAPTCPVWPCSVLRLQSRRTLRTEYREKALQFHYEWARYKAPSYHNNVFSKLA